MRVGIVTGTFHPEAGGPPTYLYNLCRELVTRGHLPAVVTYGEPADGGDYPYPVYRVSRRWPIPVRLAIMTLLVFRVGWSQDVLFVNDYGLPGLIANVVLRRPMATKIVGDFAWEFSIRHGLVPRGMTIDEFQGFGGGARVRLVRALQSLYVRRSRVVITPSRYLRNLVTGWGVKGDAVRVIYNGVEPVDVDRAAGARSLREQLGLSPDGEIALTIARLTPWKGVDRLIDVFGRVCARRPQAHLVVVGDGPELPRLRLKAGTAGLDRAVTFLGHQPRERIPLYLAGADLLVLYSAYEGLSHVLLEGMSAGLPVVASTSGGNPELVAHGVTGLTVDYGDDAALEEAVVRLLGDRELALKLAEGAAEKARQLSWEQTVGQTLEVLADLAALGKGLEGKGLDERTIVGHQR